MRSSHSPSPAPSTGIGNWSLSSNRLMPSIELLSINCCNRVYLPEYEWFTWVSELGIPKGHRGSFDHYLRNFSGLFVHLGNRDLIRGKDKYWAAYELIDLHALDEQRTYESHDVKVHFKEEVIPEVIDLAERLIAASPERRLIFLTDYQLAESDGSDFPIEQIQKERFFSALTGHHLCFNTLYEIVQTSETGL